MSLSGLVPLTLPTPVQPKAALKPQAESVDSFSLGKFFPLKVLSCLSEYLEDSARAYLIKEGELPSSHTITKIIDTSHKILWKLPQGRPVYSAQDSDEDRQSLHLRHAYPKQVGPTCQIRVMQYVLHGAYPVAPPPQEKSIDKLSLALDSAGLETIAAKELLTHPILQPKASSGSSKKAAELVLKTEKFLSEGHRKVLQNFIEESGSIDFRSYAESLLVRREVEHNTKFFKEIGIQPLDAIPESILKSKFKMQSISNEGVKKLSLENQKSIGNILTRFALAKIYVFPASSWNISKDIDVLFEEVRNHGVIGFGGFFSRHQYIEKPHQVMEIAGNKIFGWSPGARKYSYGHSIAVVGVIKENRKEQLQKGNAGYVIYVDPNDGSNPKEPEEQQLYVISYKRFKEAVSDEFGTVVNKLDRPYSLYEALVLKDCPSITSLVYGRLPNPPYIKSADPTDNKNKTKK